MTRLVPDEGSKDARISLSDVERFIHFIEKQSECWLWTGKKDRKGYGSFWWNGQTGKAARFAYLTFRGYLGPSDDTHHLCPNVDCVNPQHLTALDRRSHLVISNSPVGINARKTHCKHGHLFDEVNTYLHGGHRYCRRCRLDQYYKSGEDAKARTRRRIKRR